MLRFGLRLAGRTLAVDSGSTPFFAHEEYVSSPTEGIVISNFFEEMGKLFTAKVGKLLTRILGNYLTEALGKVLDIYTCGLRLTMNGKRGFSPTSGRTSSISAVLSKCP